MKFLRKKAVCHHIAKINKTIKGALGTTSVKRNNYVKKQGNYHLQKTLTNKQNAIFIFDQFFPVYILDVH